MTIATVLGTVAVPLSSWAGPIEVTDEDTVEVRVLYPDKNTIYASLGDQILEPGSTDIFALQNAQVFFFVTENSLQIKDNLAGPFIWGAAPFNGIQLLYQTGANITGVSVDSTTSLPNFGSNVSFDSSDVFVNMQGLVLQPDTVVKLNIATDQVETSVPEPASWMVVATGLIAGMIGLRRKRGGHSVVQRLG